MWAVRVIASSRKGTGAVVSPTLILTCEHVVRDVEQVTVRSELGEHDYRVVERAADLDVALLEPLEGAQPWPASSILTPRALRRGRTLPENRASVQLCTDESDTPRSLDVRLRPTPPDACRVQFEVPAAREGVQHGHSGGPVVETAQYSSIPWLLGIVRARDETTVDALDHAGAGWFVPTDCIAERFDRVAALVEAPVERDPAWAAHWEPRSRGVATSADAGFFFTGRTTAYESVQRHLDEGSGLLVVTGSRGRGKSAVLARAVVLSCRRYLTLLGEEAAAAGGGYTPPQRVDAAVLARGGAPSTVAAALGEQLGLGETSPDDLLDALARERLRPSIVVDAVDEAEDPRGLMQELILPLADAGARVAVGALRRRIGSDLASDAVCVDLNQPPYRDDSAIPAYVARRLEAGRYEVGTAASVAAAVAERANGIFLVAELQARTLAARPPVDTKAPGWKTQLASSDWEAFRAYLGRFGSERERVLGLLHPLAHARGDGLKIEPPTVWLTAANRLRPAHLEPFSASDLRHAHRQAGDYLITRHEDGSARLYHEGLAEAVRVLAARERLDLEERDATPAAIAEETDDAGRSFVSALMELLPEDADAPVDAFADRDPYLLRHLPLQLADHGRTDQLFDRPGWLLAADQTTLRQALVRSAVDIPAEREAARVAVGQAVATPCTSVAERAAALRAALMRQGEHRLAARVLVALGSRDGSALPYELISGAPFPPVLATIPDAHGGAVAALALIEHEDEPLVVSAGEDGALRSWRLDGEPGAFNRGHAHSGWIRALALLKDEGGLLILSAGEDGAIRSWRLDGGLGPLAREQAGSGDITALALAGQKDEPLVLSGHDNGAIRSWRLDGEPGPLALDRAHKGKVWALAVTEYEGEPLVLSGGPDHGEIRSWQLNGEPGPFDKDFGGGIASLVVVEHQGEPLVLYGSREGTLGSWRLDGEQGPLHRSYAHDGGIQALAVAEHEGEPLVLSGGLFDGAIRSWRLDSEPGPLIRGKVHFSGIRALALAEYEGKQLVLSGGDDRSICSWRLQREPASPDTGQHHTGFIKALAVITHDGEPLVVSGGEDGALHSWHLDGEPGPLTLEHAHTSEIFALAATEHQGEPLVLSSGWDGAIRSWRLCGKRGPLTLEQAHLHGVLALAVADYEGEPLLLSGGGDGHIRSWRLDGQPGPLNPRYAHLGYCCALALVEHQGEPLVLSGGGSREAAIYSWRLDGQPGPLSLRYVHDDGILALALAECGGNPLVLTCGRDGAIRSWQLDGEPGPLACKQAHDGTAWALAVVEHHGEPLVLSGGTDGAIRSWRLDGTPGPLAREHAHGGWIRALAPVMRDGEPLLLSVGFDASGSDAILAHRIFTEPQE